MTYYKWQQDKFLIFYLVIVLKARCKFSYIQNSSTNNKLNLMNMELHPTMNQLSRLSGYVVFQTGNKTYFQFPKIQFPFHVMWLFYNSWLNGLEALFSNQQFSIPTNVRLCPNFLGEKLFPAFIMCKSDIFWLFFLFAQLAFTL